MIAGIWTTTEFKQRTTYVFSGRTQLLKDIDAALDEGHSRPEEQALLALSFIERACDAWIAAHPHTSSTKVPGKKFSGRRKAIETLQGQMAARRLELYRSSPDEDKRREAITAQYETSDKVLLIGPGDTDPRRDKGRAAFHQELLEATIKRAQRLGHKKEDFNTEQLGFMGAKLALKIDSVIDKKKHAQCKVEALRILSAMLSKNRQLALAFETSGIEVVVVPADKAMTALPEFASLRGVGINQAGGTARGWDITRGVGGVKVGSKVYVAVTEENLLGTTVAMSVPGAGGTCYGARYSTTSHEFAHSLHRYAMTAEQKLVITNAFKKRKRAKVDGPTSVITIEDTTLAPTQVELDKVFNVEWVDGPRKMGTLLPTPKLYWVKQTNNTYAELPRAPGATTPNYFRYSSTYELKDCYAAFDENEYFAQCANAYLGANGSTDPYTRRPRHNGQEWIRANEPAELVQLLDELFSAGTHSHFAYTELPDTNVALVEPRDLNISQLIRQRQLARTIKERRAAMGYGDDEDDDDDDDAP